MGEEKKKKGFGLGKLFGMLIILGVASYAGWFAYAKVTNRPDC